MRRRINAYVEVERGWFRKYGNQVSCVLQDAYTVYACVEEEDTYICVCAPVCVHRVCMYVHTVYVCKNAHTVCERASPCMLMMYEGTVSARMYERTVSPYERTVSPGCMREQYLHV